MTHPICDWYGHSFQKNATLSSLASRNVKVEECERCGKQRRVANV